MLSYEQLDMKENKFAWHGPWNKESLPSYPELNRTSNYHKIRSSMVHRGQTNLLLVTGASLDRMPRQHISVINVLTIYILVMKLVQV